jgi:YHS domain-containing protein
MKNNQTGRILIASLVSLIIAAVPTAVWAKKTYINADRQGVAIKGYDTVAYFTEGRPVKGNKQFEYSWQDAKWRFANEKHMEMFISDPEKYMPQYGGY